MDEIGVPSPGHITKYEGRKVLGSSVVSNCKEDF
jgi:hypothetical protein